LKELPDNQDTLSQKGVRSVVVENDEARKAEYAAHYSVDRSGCKNFSDLLAQINDGK
jgi:hypothetical protein